MFDNVLGLLYQWHNMKGKQLRAIRDKLGWTQAQMATALEVKPNTVARWERDERGISDLATKLIEMIYAAKRGKKVG